MARARSIAAVGVACVAVVAAGAPAATVPTPTVQSPVMAAAPGKAGAVSVRGSGDTKAQRRASVKARTTGRSVSVSAEMKSARSLTANPDGSFTWVSHAAPVRVQRGGVWRNIDSRLRRSGAFVKPRVGGTGIWLARSGKGPLVQIASHNQALRDSEDGELSVGVGQRGKGPRLSFDVAGKAKVKAPRLTGNTAVYRGVWPGVNARVSAEASGISQRFVSSKGRARFPLKLNASGGLSMKVTRGGMISFRGPRGREVGSSGRPIVSEADGGHDPKVLGSARFVKVRGAGNGRVDVVVPAKVMRAAQGSTISVDATLPLSASSATYVQKSYPTQNMAGRGYIKAGGHPDGPGPVENTVSNALVKFGGVGTLNQKAVLSANLEVWNFHCGACGEGHLDAKLVTAPWEATKATWSNRPTHNGNIGGSINDGKGGNDQQHCAAGWLNLDNMKPVAAKWAENPANAYGVMLMPLTDSNLKQYKQFDTVSGQYSAHPPKMTVTYLGKPAPPSQVAVDHVSTPHPVLASVAPPYADGGAMTMVFEIRRGAAVVWSGQVATQPGARTSMTVPVPQADGQGYTAFAKVIVSSAGGAVTSDYSSPPTVFAIDTRVDVGPLQVVPSLANVAPSADGVIYTQLVKPQLRVHLTETVPSEQFTVTFGFFKNHTDTVPVFPVKTLARTGTGWVEWTFNESLLDGQSYEARMVVTDQDSPTHNEFGSPMIVNVQAPCKLPAARSTLQALCVDGATL